VSKYLLRTVMIVVLVLLIFLLQVMGIDFGGMRILGAILLITILPGLALVQLLFAEGSLDLPETMAFALGMSVSFTALSGLLLNWSVWGLQNWSWMIWLSSFTLIVCVLAILFPRNRATQINRKTGNFRFGLSMRDILLFAMGGTLTIGALFVAYQGAKDRPVAGFTQLAMAWSSPDGSTAQITITNHENGAALYRLQLKTSGVVADEWPAIKLNPGDTWQTEIRVLPEYQDAHQIEAVLFLGDSPIIYRQVVLKRSR